jgi:hypothetical protein
MGAACSVTSTTVICGIKLSCSTAFVPSVHDTGPSAVYSYSAGQEIFCCGMKSRYCVHKCPPFDPILYQ